MMNSASKYSESHIWKKYLAQQDGQDIYAKPRGRLRESFEKAREAITPLVAKIAQQLPGLTIHNITHLDALWGVADTIIGSDYPLNPAEVYVLGMAFLIHDAATSTFAFTNGLDDVQQTIEWRDYVCQQDLSIDVLREDQKKFQAAIFETLRLIHAKQSESLLVRSWTDLRGTERFLLEDPQLRNHYGRVIGKIAGSHGEDPAIVEARWAHMPPLSPHVSLELDALADWSVDCLKVSMLVRCIDAAHIDALRAPDAEAMLLELTGTSRNHWIFQNRLGKIAKNNRSELYWSASSFTEKEADAWWTCFDTCVMIDREIKSANRILTDRRLPPLAALGVMGVNDISVFLQNIPTEGWQPVDFDFKVSRIGNVIETFGGQKLYGERPHLALKELIQNAADAVRARRAYSGKQNHGQIEIRLRKDHDHWWLDVEDDGIGMSNYVLTEVLLDFGRSLWKDSALRSQWRGLASRNFSAMGQFGIGFFSVFMLGDEVKITTWPFGSSQDEQKLLHLRNRVVDRPILLSPDESEKLGEPGTRISVKLKDGRKSLLRTYKIYKDYVKYEKVDREEELAELLGGIAPALDIDVFIKDDKYDKAEVAEYSSANDWMSISNEELLRRIYPTLNDRAIKAQARKMGSILGEAGEVIGRARLAAEDEGAALLIHRGIVSGKFEGAFGLLLSGNNNDLARQKAEPIANHASLSVWAREQIKEIDDENSPSFSEKVVSLGGFSPSLVVGKLGGEEVTAEELLQFFVENGASSLTILVDWPDCPDDMPKSNFEDFVLDAEVLDLSECYAENRFDFGLEEWIEKVLPSDEGPRSLLDTLIYFICSELKMGMQMEHVHKRLGEANGDEVCGFCFEYKNYATNDSIIITN